MEDEAKKRIEDMVMEIQRRVFGLNPNDCIVALEGVINQLKDEVKARGMG